MELFIRKTIKGRMCNNHHIWRFSCVYINHYVTTAVQTNVMEGKQTKTPQQIVLRKEKWLRRGGSAMKAHSTPSKRSLSTFWAKGDITTTRCLRLLCSSCRTSIKTLTTCHQLSYDIHNEPSGNVPENLMFICDLINCQINFNTPVVTMETEEMAAEWTPVWYDYIFTCARVASGVVSW